MSSDVEHWFYMVKTRSTDPAKEREFNLWYDDIDIPDVLAVSGFKRARRAVMPFIAGAEQVPQVREGKYVALYDIQTKDIDKSIIDLYVAARKMVALGRISDLLKVTEANYYRRLQSTGVLKQSRQTNENTYIYIQKVLCCRDTNNTTRFRLWYEQAYIQRLKENKAFRGADLYELYRIMEEVAVSPEEIPHFLLVSEFYAESPGQLIDELRQMMQLNKTFIEGDDSALYLQISDVTSN